MITHNITWDDEQDSSNPAPPAYPSLESSGNLKSSNSHLMGLSTYMKTEPETEENNLPHFGQPPSPPVQTVDPSTQTIPKPCAPSDSIKIAAVDPIVEMPSFETKVQQANYFTFNRQTYSNLVHPSTKSQAPVQPLQRKPTPINSGKHKKSAQGHWITHINIQLEKRIIEAKSSNQQVFLKEISKEYLEYLERYFLYMQNIPLPFHSQSVWQEPQSNSLRPFLQCYFDYLTLKHPHKLYSFFEKQKFKSEAQLTETTPQQPQVLTDKISHVFLTNLKYGLGFLTQHIKHALKYEDDPRKQKLKSLRGLLSQSVLLSLKSAQYRSKTSNILSGFQTTEMPQQRLDPSSLQICLGIINWLEGFDNTLQHLKSLMQNETQLVQADKAKKLFETFSREWTLQLQEKSAILQNSIRQMYTKCLKK